MSMHSNKGQQEGTTLEDDLQYFVSHYGSKKAEFYGNKLSWNDRVGAVFKLTKQ